MSLTYVGEDVEKQEPSHIAGGNVTWYSHLEKFVKKLNINLLYKPTISTQRNENYAHKKSLQVNAHRNIMHHSQKGSNPCPTVNRHAKFIYWNTIQQVVLTEMLTHAMIWTSNTLYYIKTRLKRYHCIILFI